jgi:hypothetical protein
VPAAIQKTITENSGGGKIEEIEIKVGEDGKLIAIDKD